MIGTVGIRDLEVECVLGVYDEERLTSRSVRIDIEVDYDMESIVRSDQIRDGIDYDRIVEISREHAAWAKYRTLEALVGGIVDLLARAYPFVERIKVAAAKPGAIPGATESWVTVEITGET